MTVPIVEALARQYPHLRITMVSRPFVGSIFKRLPQNVQFVGINLAQYKGLGGLERLYRELRALEPDAVCDLHDVLRTKYLRLRFRMAGIPVSHIVKDRRARKAFLHAAHKVQQETSFERHAKAIARLLPFKQPTPPCQLASQATHRGGIGIAPFAAHQGKIYPLQQMERVVSLLSAQGTEVYLFGAGEKEQSIMEQWDKTYEHAHSMVGRLGNMAGELDWIAGLDAMLTMDSGNMHLASLTCTPVLSIWGATHPLGGFLGWGQTIDRCIQKDYPCRPCSIFGNKPCRLGDFRCLHDITPDEIVNRLNEVVRTRRSSNVH